MKSKITKSLKSGISRVRSFLIDWVWQLPQNIVGIITYTLLKKRKHAKAAYNNLSVVVAQCPKIVSAVTIGKYILMKDARYYKRSVRHEIGHVYQSLYLGPLYIIVIGLPSLLHCMCYIGDYYSFYTEKWAETLYKKHLKEVNFLMSEISM